MSHTHLFISCYLDVREAKRKLNIKESEKIPGTHPVKIRVFDSHLKKAKFYRTVFRLSQNQFKDSYESNKPRGENKALQDKLKAAETLITDRANTLKVFTFEAFDAIMKGQKDTTGNLFSKYTEAIKVLTDNDQLGTASTYELSAKSLKDFMVNDLNNKKDRITFAEITPNWLNKYEKYMIETKERSSTTVSMYVRTLRTLFNTAIREGEVDRETYPFGLAKHGKYEVPDSNNKKKALDVETLRSLRDGKTYNEEQERAKSFWFFSYTCNGINVKDIALLKWSDIDGEAVEFLRAKTLRTKKRKQSKINFFLNSYSQSTIDKYGNDKNKPDGYVFEIIDNKMSATDKRNAIKNFTRFINQNFQKYANSNNIKGKFSTYVARHSWASYSLRELGKSMEEIGEALGHSDMKTTKNYIASLGDTKKKEWSDSNMNF